MISGVISRVTIVITHIRGHITPLITIHELPSKLKALYLSRIPVDPFKGTLKGTLVTAHEPPSKHANFTTGVMDCPSMSPHMHTGAKRCASKNPRQHLNQQNVLV